MPWWMIPAILGSSLLSSRSSDRAADAQTAANQQAIEEQRRQFNAVLDLTAPQRDISNQALNVLAQMFGLPGANLGGTTQTTEGPMSLDQLRQAGGNPTRMPGQRVIGQANSIADLMNPGGPTTGMPVATTPTASLGAGGGMPGGFSLDNIPGTRFLIDETMRNITNAGSTSPGGNVLAALADRVSGIAGDRTFNSLFQLAGFGPQATQTAAGAGLQTGSNVGNLLNASGIANASGILGQGNAANNAINNLMMWQLLGGT